MSQLNDGNDDTRILNIVIVGTAGQGVITLKRLIEFIAAEEGYEGIFGSEMHGLAQREGAISSHCRLQKKKSENIRENIFSPTICYGDADLVIGFEPVEILRNAGQFASDKTTFVVNERTIPPILVTAGKETYPSLDEIKEMLVQYSHDPGHVASLNATELAITELDDAQKMNMIMFGFAMVTGLLDFTLETCETVVRRELRDADANMAAIRLGMERGRDVLKK
ncbi:MAG TPA: 2-oxoacid:acceptor oxidoreductase family protein [Candidatus Lokiarchaeia archaeon]|nr:2-oxoacid:acceptor oxidoreductase family protein [Candidatus Lokiarchaeia archaeon]